MKKYFSLLLIVCLFVTCNKNDECDGKIKDYNAHLYGIYDNPASGSPSLDVDLSNSSKEINIELNPTVTEQNGRILFNYSGVTFKEGKNVYVLNDGAKDVVTEKKNSDGCWLIDDENKLSWTFSKSLDIVLVLDVSSSLGTNIEDVKSNAKQMVTNVLSDNPDAQIAIIKFSRGSVIKDFSSSESQLHQFIAQNTTFTSTDIGNYQLEGRSETALYESINHAIDLLEISDARGQAILTFTDGVSNYQIDPQFQNPTSIINRLSSSSISSYTIGFEGNQGSIDKNILEQISINGDFSFPKSLDELNKVFERFSNSVAAVYDLIYNKNNAKLIEKESYRFLFNTTRVSQ